MRKSEDYYKFETLNHCCIHTRNQINPDKAVEKEKTTRPYAGDKAHFEAVTRRPTRRTSRDTQTWRRPGPGGEERLDGARHGHVASPFFRRVWT